LIIAAATLLLNFFFLPFSSFFSSFFFPSGRVFNVSRRAVGVTVNKRIKNRYVQKQINVRIEHVKHSTCRLEFLKRLADNDAKKTAAKAAGQPAPNTKRLPQQPRPGHFVSAKGNKPTLVQPIPFDFMF
jgi:large subunit ribosomal protein L21e